MLHREMDDRMTDAPTLGGLLLDQAADAAHVVGQRAERLGRMCALGLPVPPGLALNFETVAGLAEGAHPPDLPADVGPIVALRASPQDRRWGGPQSILNLGLCDAVLPRLSHAIGARGALEAYRRAIRSYAVRVGGLDPEDFDNLYYDHSKLNPSLRVQDLEEVVAASKALYADELGEGFPQDFTTQLTGALRSMAAEWHAPTARMLRAARNAPEDAGLGLIVQRMVFGLGGPQSGVGSFQSVDSSTGEASATGRYLPDAQGQDAGRGLRPPHMITEGGPIERVAQRTM